MNRHLHRIVFNAARGIRVVVQETARNTGKGSSKATAAVVGALAGAAALVPMLIGAALAGMLSTTSAHAQIAGAPSVSGNLRATVLVAIAERGKQLELVAHPIRSKRGHLS